jgi:hypothetical protein
MSYDEIWDNLDSINDEFIGLMENELSTFWNNNQHIIETNRKAIEVISGILSRQLSISTHFIKSANMMNHDIAPIILRSIADNIINLAWIMVDVDNRVDMFIKYGLGQEKLCLEHKREQMKKDGKDPDEDPVIKATQTWFTTFRYPELTDVDLGMWSGLPTRAMADDAGCIDFYNYVYLPFSSAVHNQWNHILKYNLARSDNPMHKGLLYPRFNNDYADTSYLILIAKYIEKAFRITYQSDYFSKPQERLSLYEWYVNKHKNIHIQKSTSQ